MEGYTGEGEPPCMTFKAVSDKTTPPDLSLHATLTGVRGLKDKKLQIKRPAEGKSIVLFLHAPLIGFFNSVCSEWLSLGLIEQACD